MDPVSILGVAGSVVGIAGFGLQLAQFLEKFIAGYAEAHESFHTILEGIDATNDALEQVRGFLVDENENVKRSGKHKLFSAKALSKIESTANQCLKIFWRIEATILMKSTSDLEVTISAKLAWFHNEIKAKREPPVLELDKGLKISKLLRFRWTFNLGDILEKYNRHLFNLQTTLILMFQVISIRFNLTKPNPGLNDILINHQLYEQIPYMVAQSDLPEARMNRPPSYPYPCGPPQPFARSWIDEPGLAQAWR